MLDGMYDLEVGKGDEHEGGDDRLYGEACGAGGEGAEEGGSYRERRCRRHSAAPTEKGRKKRKEQKLLMNVVRLLECTENSSWCGEVLDRPLRTVVRAERTRSG